jgi:hypothetical protein
VGYLNAVDFERGIRQVLGGFVNLLDGDRAQSVGTSTLKLVNTGEGNETGKLFSTFDSLPGLAWLPAPP